MEIISTTTEINSKSGCWFCGDIPLSFNGFHYGLCSSCYYEKYYFPRKKKIHNKFRDLILRYIQLHLLRLKLKKLHSLSP